jgi:hypothetical protein
MGWRFRKSFQLIPGVRLNIGSGGIGLNVGVPGASVSINSKRTALNLGIPGTGLGYQHTLVKHEPPAPGAYRRTLIEFSQAPPAVRAASLTVGVSRIAGGGLVGSDQYLGDLKNCLPKRVKTPFDFEAWLTQDQPFKQPGKCPESCVPGSSERVIRATPPGAPHVPAKAP